MRGCFRVLRLREEFVVFKSVVEASDSLYVCFSHFESLEWYVLNIVDVMNHESRTVDVTNVWSVCCLMIGKWQNLCPWRIGPQVAFVDSSSSFKAIDY